MPPEQLLALLRAHPFVPFRVTLTDGRQFDVRHPDMAMPGRRFVVIGIPETDGGDYVGRTITVALVHLTSLEPLELRANES
jgi:hypothetical protein